MKRYAKQGKLHRKILAWSFTPTALILLAVALVNFQAYQQVTEDLVLQRNRELARLLASRVSSELFSLTRRFEDFSQTLSLQDQDPALQQEDQAYVQNSFGLFDGGIWVYPFSSRRSVEIWAGSQPLVQNFSQTPLYRQMELRRSRFQDPVVSDVTALTASGEPLLALSVFYPSRPGLLVGLSQLKPSEDTGFYRWISSLRIASRGTVYITDGSGRVIYHSQPEWIGQDFSDQEVVRQVVAGKVGSLRTRDRDGRDVVVSYAPVLGTRWGLVIQENWTTLIASSQGYIYFLLFLLVLGVVVPAVVVSLSVRRITRPIQALTVAAQEVAGGKFDRVIYAPTGDEVEALAEQFNRMSLQLQESYASLEKRVADRTRALATLNAISSVVSQSLDLEEILESALQTTREALGMEAGSILLQQKDKGPLVMVTHIGLSSRFVSQVPFINLDEGAAGEAARTGLPVIRHLEDYSAHEQNLQQALRDEGLQLVVSIPLLSKGHMLGTMNLSSRYPHALAVEEVDMLAAIGKQVGVAVENARLYAQAEEAATAAERNRLARELHDAVTQTLFSVSLISEVLPKLWEMNPEAGRQKLEDLRQLTKGALAEMRSLLVELRPAALVETDARELFRYLVLAFAGRELIPVQLNIELEQDLPADVKVAFYRIAQESLNNIAKHARASQVVIDLAAQHGQVRMVIADDGQGFYPDQVPADHFGLRILRERAESIGASLTIDSEIDQGSQVSVVWSVEAEQVQHG